MTKRQNNSRPNRARKQTEAAERNAERKLRTVGHQLAILDLRPGFALRERARLSEGA